MSHQLSVKNSTVLFMIAIFLTLSLIEQLKIKKFPAVKLQGIARGRLPASNTQGDVKRDYFQLKSSAISEFHSLKSSKRWENGVNDL